MIQFEIIQEKGRIQEYREYWNRLFDSGKFEFTTSFEWTQALLSTHLEKDTFLLIVFRDTEEILGIVPMVINQIKKYGVSLSNLFPISDYYNNFHSDLLFKNVTEELIKTFITSLFSLGYKWDVFRISRFIETNPILDCIERFLKESSIRYEIKREEPSFFLSLDGTYNDYLKKRSYNFRKYIKKQIKKLTRDISHVEFVKHQNFNNFPDAYNQVLYIEKESWKHKHGTAISSTEKSNNFYRILCESASEREWLHLFILLLNNEPAAYNIGFVKDKKYFYLKTSFNEKFREVSPSSILRAKLIEELIREGIKEIDFFAEPYEWQRRWAEELRWHKSLLIYNKTYKAKLFSIYHSLKHKKAKFSAEDQFVYHNPLDVKPEKS